MPEENPSAMNLDLNLGPLDNSSDDGDSGTGSNPAINITDWLESPVRRVRQVVRNRTRRLSPWSRQIPMPQTRPLGDISVPTGDDSKIPEKNPDSCTDDNVHGEKDDISKKNGGENSFFDCNICLDVAKDPVVTCCGHLFCWPCLYRWLHHHSSAKECPICKGEVNPKNMVPIYGRGDTIRNPPNTDPSLPIPVRPQAHRVESWRQTVRSNAFAIPIQEVITHLATMSDLRRAQREQGQNPDNHDRDHEESMGGINRLLHSRLLTSSGMRRERPNPGGLVDFDDTEFHAWTSIHEFQSGAEGVAEPDTHSSNPVVIPTPFDDRDSLSSIAAVIQSESQTVDNVVEIDSTVARSTSSSRRTNDASRIPDVDSGDSRAPRRRRFTEVPFMCFLFLFFVFLQESRFRFVVVLVMFMSPFKFCSLVRFIV